MENKIYFRDLPCYASLSDAEKEHKLMCPNRYFDLDKLPSQGLKDELSSFILDRGTRLRALSMRAEFYPFNMLCDFFSDMYPTLESICNEQLDLLEKSVRAWLLKNGKSLFQTSYRVASDKEVRKEPELILYIRKLYEFCSNDVKAFSYDSDRWYLKDIPIEIRENPTNKIRSISFEKIKQDKIRDELKQAVYLHLSTNALGTVVAEMTAANRFCLYLSEQYPHIESLSQVDRNLLEDYLVYINTIVSGKKSYSKELFHLRGLLVTVGKYLECKVLEDIFYKDDFGKIPEKLYKAYSDSEMKRLNAAIVEADEQVARALIIHQLLGTRISETLSLRKDSVYKSDSGKWMVRIRQIKTRHTYTKVINDDVKALFDKACEYTYQKYGETEYVFVNDKNPKIPMQYRRIQYQLMAMITRNDLVDDNGVRFGVGTHIWRHCYGKKLTEMHVDDITISKLMGHANTRSLKSYRKVGNDILKKESKPMRDMMDELLSDIVSQWH